ncbi:hypothetical protein GCM10011399_37380 [Subtercola lobariae]|uniref:Uncharacterized protein n=1 Tax=Subtercola lobariae TaxID=1588641 RepID=A0A917BFJ4_9MICO|nr:hypothetical protein GCM10011399_37380 [Subtercola lobariae]
MRELSNGAVSRPHPFTLTTSRRQGRILCLADGAPFVGDPMFDVIDAITMRGSELPRRY